MPPLPAGGPQALPQGRALPHEKCAVERRSYPPGEHGRGRIKQSEYLLQLREKQKARRYYGLLERQFRTTRRRAAGRARRARTCCACSRRVSTTSSTASASPARARRRQLVRHGHFQVNGRRVNIPSYGVRPGDVVALRQGSPVEQPRPRRDRPDRLGGPVAPGRSRRAHGHGAQVARARRDRRVGPGIAHRRALFEVSGCRRIRPEQERKDRLGYTNQLDGVPDPEDRPRGRRRQPRRLRHRAARRGFGTPSGTRSAACCSPRSRGRR